MVTVISIVVVVVVVLGDLILEQKLVTKRFLIIILIDRRMILVGSIQIIEISALQKNQEYGYALNVQKILNGKYLQYQYKLVDNK